MTENNSDKIELAIRRNNEVQGKKNSSSFAIKLVEKIVFGLVTLMLTAVIIALISLVVTK